MLKQAMNTGLSIIFGILLTVSPWGQMTISKSMGNNIQRANNIQNSDYLHNQYNPDFDRMLNHLNGVKPPRVRK